MKETRYFYVPDAVRQSELPPEEAAHATKVLRLKEGDEMMLMDGQGTFYRAEVTLASNHHCMYHIIESLPQQRLWNGRIHLAMAPTKMNERTEWMVEKAVEVGIDEISFLNCQFSERHSLKMERIQKIVVAAAKQSRAAFMPNIHDLAKFKAFVDSHSSGNRYIAHCYDEVPRINLFDSLCLLSPSDDALVMIGPEGDFSIDEVRYAVECGFISVDLGKSRLRTETAGLSAVMMMQLAKQRH
jgi:16S rRNA (uracil1498-N3)-methyltransferase